MRKSDLLCSFRYVRYPMRIREIRHGIVGLAQVASHHAGCMVVGGSPQRIAALPPCRHSLVHQSHQYRTPEERNDPQEDAGQCGCSIRSLPNMGIPRRLR